jgi:hypothetical protein
VSTPTPDALAAAAEYDRDRERFHQLRFGASIAEMLVRMKRGVWPPRAWRKS